MGAVVQQSRNATPASLVGSNTAGQSNAVTAAAEKLIPANAGGFVSPTPARTIVVAPAASRLYDFDTSVGSAAPPDTLGGYVMTPFGPDPSGAPSWVTSVASPCPIPGSIQFSRRVSHRRAGSSWSSWSHGYTGDVYFTVGAQSMTITLPTSSCAFYFYVQPSSYDLFTFTVTADDGTSASFDAHGSAGAAYCGVYGEDLSSVAISSSVDFAIGEFALACACGSVGRACCYEAVPEAYCETDVDVMECLATGGRSDVNVFECEDLDPPCGEYIGACCYGAIADPGYEPWQCIGDMLQWECLFLSESTNWTGGESCSDPSFLCPGTPAYCDASGGCMEHIARVQIGDIDNPSICEGYGDYTTMWTMVIPGLDYPLTVTNGRPHPMDTCSVWVDWNRDKTFEDEGDEWIGDLGGGGPYNFTLTIPSSFTPGYTRMRIRIDYGNPNPDPCGTTGYGDVEDYSLLVVGDEAACCNIYDGHCVDDVVALDCFAMGAAYQYRYGETCAGMDPPCGDPGCCCDSPEPGEVTAPHTEFRVNCDGRFLAGVVAAECIAQAWFEPCGLWSPHNVLYAPAWTDNAGFRAALSALLMSDVDYWDASSSGTPPLATMLDYAAVITWVNQRYGDAVGMGDTLADYVDAGGRVILGQWCKRSTQPNYLLGRIMDDPAYCPVLACSTASGSGAYNNDGVVCPHNGPAGAVGDHDTPYLDVVSSIAPGALTDGTIGETFSVVSTPTAGVWYVPGFTAAQFGNGAAEWTKKIANVVLCDWMIPGACCNVTNAECQDDVLIADCAAMGLQWRADYGVTCEEMVPPCGDPGACCNIYTGECADDVLKANCQGQHHSGIGCGEMNPRCGNPGCCCESPEEGVVTNPVESLRANCLGRFVSLADGEPCTADLFTPECGLWVPTGVLYCPANSYADENFLSTLSTLLGGQPVEFVNAMYTTPSVEEMRNYAAVFVWVDFALADKVAMGNNLADYVDMGGRVILGQWCFPTANNYLAGRIMDDPAYCPVASAAGWTAGPSLYMGDGEMCATADVTTLQTNALDIIIGLQPGAMWDGHIGDSYAAIWNANWNVWYSPGNKGGWNQSGDWARLTYNEIVCRNVPGPCCNIHTAECVDDLRPMECHDHGNGWQWHSVGTCATLVPPCGDPGCCCERPEEGELKEPVEALRANCDGRFLSGVLGADCVVDAWDPPCGEWIARDVLYAPTRSDKADFRAALAALLGNRNVDYYDARIGTPSLDSLRQYAAVITWVDYAYADAVGMGNVLADYVDAGGRVILGQWCRKSNQNSCLKGRIMDDPAYCPVLACSGFSSGVYNQDGTGCPHNGSAGVVGAHASNLLDLVTTIAPDAIVDGTIGTPPQTTPSVVGNPSASVWYLPGFTAGHYGIGDWVTKAANVVVCNWDMPSACCNIMTAQCDDDVSVTDCATRGSQWKANAFMACADLVPPCGDPGACCDIHSGACLDDVLAIVCKQMGREAHSRVLCDELEPACGDPGCCCDFPEPGYMVDPHFAFRANCAGRFIPGAFVLCGDLDENGVVDMTDYNAFLDAFGKCTGQSGFIAAADLDGDGCITLVDFQAWRNCYQYQGTNCYAEAFDPPCGEEQLSCDAGPGTAAPPTDLCGLPMTPFPTDNRALYSDIIDLPAPCPIPDTGILFSRAVNHRRINEGWTSWSHGYTGDVYYTNGATSITLTMPVGTSAVYFYVEPNPLALHTFQVTVNGWFVCEEFTAHGSAGAAYIGVCGNPVKMVTVTCTSGVPFAIGEFGIKCDDVPGACCDEAAGTCTDDVLATECALRFKASRTCDQLNPPCGEIRGACCYGQECSYERPSECAGEYQGDGAPCDPNPCLCYDLWVYPQGDPPLVLTGTTCGMGDDCALRPTEDAIIAVEIGWPGTWTFSLCGTSFDSFWFFGNDCCTAYWSQDDSPECGMAGYLSTHFEPGVYYIHLEGSNGCGNYTLTISGPPEPAPGACCDDLSFACTDGVMPADCIGQHMRHDQGGKCDELSPACGNGACCDDETGECVDDVNELQCNASRFAVGVLCEALNPPCTPCEDVQLIAPGIWSGTTVGAGDDCALRAGQDIIVKVTVPTDGDWRFDLCASSPAWDTYMHIGTECCQSTWSNDDGCASYWPLSTIVLTGIPAGDYYVDIEPSNGIASAPVTLMVWEAAPADRTAAPAEVAPSKLEQLTPAAR